MPSTETCRLRSVVRATFTCGLFRKLPRLSASAICPAAAAVVSPATFTGPTSGIEMLPLSAIRVSSVRSGCWNTVTRTASPTPSLSPACASARPLIVHSSIHSTSPITACLISPRLSFVSRSSPFDVSYVLDARTVAQPAHLCGGELHALLGRQELLDHARRLLLGKRRLGRVHELHYRSPERRAEHRDVAFFHARDVRQLRQRQLLGRLREIEGAEAHVALPQPRRDIVEVGSARRLHAQHVDELRRRRDRELAQPVDAPLGEQRRVAGIEGAHLFGRAAGCRCPGALEVGLREELAPRLVDRLRHLRVAVEAGFERFLHQELAVDDPFERLRAAAVARRDLGAVHLGHHERRAGPEGRGALAAARGERRGRYPEQNAGAQHHSMYPSRRRATHTAAAKPERRSSPSCGSRASATENCALAGAVATRIGASAAVTGNTLAAGPATVARYRSTNEYCEGCTAGPRCSAPWKESSAPAAHGTSGAASANSRQTTVLENFMGSGRCILRGGCYGTEPSGLIPHPPYGLQKQNGGRSP